MAASRPVEAHGSAFTITLGTTVGEPGARSALWSPTMVRYCTEHKARTRQRILGAAVAAFRKGGLHRVSIAAVMRQAGLTHGGFYAHFSSRDDLLTMAMDQMFDHAFEAFFAGAEERDPREVLTTYVDFYLSSLHLNLRGQGCPVPILAADLDRLPERASERFGIAMRRTRDAVATALARTGVADEVERADAAIAEMVGAVTLARVSDAVEADGLLRAARQSVYRKLSLADPAGRSRT